MSTIIVAAIVFAAVAYVVYRQFFSGASGCDDCSNVGCPLIDQTHVSKILNK